MAILITLIEARKEAETALSRALRAKGYRVNPSPRLTMDQGLLEAPPQDALIVNLAHSRGDEGLQPFRQSDPAMVVIALSDLSPPTSDPYVLQHPVHAVLPNTASTEEIVDTLTRELANSGRFIERITWPDRQIFLSAGLLQVGDRKYSLTTNECALIRYLAGNSTRAVSRSELLTRVWGYREGVYTRAVDSTIKRLRPKLEVNPKEPTIIRSIRGVGYQLNLGDGIVTQRGSEEPAPTPAPIPTGPPPIAPHLSAFFGREEETARLNELVESGRRLITVTGPGGMGKSRLVREWAIESERVVWLCDLSEALHSQDIARIFASTLLSSDEQSAGDQEALTTRMATLENNVIVLDNIEQLGAGVGDFLAPLLKAPGPQFLCTSTTRLRKRGEICLELMPLKASLATSMLTDRVETLRGSTIQEMPAEVASLAEFLDGHPLAIELAASQSRLLGIADLYRRLKSNELTLRGPNHREQDRPIQLESVIHSSWELLNEEEQQVLLQCATFRGGFSTDAASSVVKLNNSDRPIFEILQILREHSFLHITPRTDGQLRLNMYRSIFQFVHERVQHISDLPALENRHKDYYLAKFSPFLTYDRGMILAERFSTQSSFRYALQDEQDNLLAIRERFQSREPESAIEALLIWDWLSVSFESGTVRELALAEASRIADSLPADLQARLGIAMGSIQSSQGREELGLTTLTSALALVDQLTPLLAIDLYRAIGWTHLLQLSGVPHECATSAQTYFQLAKEQAETHQLTKPLATIGHELGRTHMMLGLPHECEEAFQGSLAAAIACGEPGPLCHAEYGLGFLYLNLGRYAESEQIFSRLQERYRQMGGFRWREIALFLGWVDIGKGKPDKAAAMLETLRVTPHNLSDPGHDIFVALELALCCILMNDHTRASSLYEEVEANALTDAGPFSYSVCTVMLAYCEAVCGQTPRPSHVLPHPTIRSEVLALQATQAATEWIAAGRKAENKSGVEEKLATLNQRWRDSSEYTHTQLNWFARIIAGLILQEIDR